MKNSSSKFIPIIEIAFHAIKSYSSVTIAAFLFQLIGLFHLLLILGFLLKDIDSYEGHNFFQIIGEINIIIPLIYAIFYVLTGFFISKRKYWAYILGWLITIITLMIYLMGFIQGEAPILIVPILSVAILIFLIKGRDEFI